MVLGFVIWVRVRGLDLKLSFYLYDDKIDNVTIRRKRISENTTRSGRVTEVPPTGSDDFRNVVINFLTYEILCHN